MAVVFPIKRSITHHSGKADLADVKSYGRKRCTNGRENCDKEKGRIEKEIGGSQNSWFGLVVLAQTANITHVMLMRNEFNTFDIHLKVSSLFNLISSQRMVTEKRRIMKL